MKLITHLVVVGLLLGGVRAHAQTADLPPIPLKGAPRVIVTDRSGQETIGRLVSWTESSIVIKWNGEDRSYAADEVVRVDLRGDSVKNGFLAGAILGSLPWLIGGCDCSNNTVAVLAAMGIWGAFGAGIDALIPGRSPLWSSGASAKSARGFTFDISPRERRASIGWRLQLP